VPVWGQYYSDELTQANYTVNVTNATSSATIPCFTTLSDVVKVRKARSDSKSTPTSVKKANPPMTTDEELFEPLVEPTISLVDGSSGSNYLFINDTSGLLQKAELWNNWISQFSDYTDPLTTVSRDLGVNVCCSLGVTRHWIDTPSSALEIRKQRVDTRMEKRKFLMADPYATRDVILTSFFDKPNSPVFDRIQQMWLLPINNSVTTAIPQSGTLWQKVTLNLVETNNVPTSNETTGTTLSFINSQFVNSLIKAKSAPLSAEAQFFLDMDRQGKGGVLSGLVANFIGSAFGSTAGSIAGTVAQFLPI